MSELDVPPLPPEKTFIDSVPIGAKLPYVCLPDLALLSYVRQLHDGPTIWISCPATPPPCLRHYRSTLFVRS